MIEDAGRHFRGDRPAPLVDLVDPQPLRRRVDVPAEQSSDARLDLRLEVGAVGPVERDRRLDRLGLRPAARYQVERQALARNGGIGKASGSVQPVGGRRRIELAGKSDEILLAALAGEVDQQRGPFEMVAGFGPVALAVGCRLPVVVEEFAERPAFGIEEMAAEQGDDPGRGGEDSSRSPVTVCQARKASSRCICGFDRRISWPSGVSRKPVSLTSSRCASRKANVSRASCSAPGCPMRCASASAKSTQE